MLHRLVIVAVFISIITADTKADAADIKSQWVFALSEHMTILSFGDGLLNTPCKQHLPEPTTDSIGNLKNNLDAMFPTKTGKRNFKEIFDFVQNHEAYLKMYRLAQDFILQVVRSSTNDGKVGKSTCLELKQKYSQLAETNWSVLVGKTNELLKIFPDGIKRESF